jgi:molecular chaperone DnaK (HSP70)
MMDNNLDDRLGIEIRSGFVYVAAYDKERCKPMLLENADGHTKTSLTIAFVGDEHVIGRAAQAQQDANADNTFRDLDTLLGSSFQDKAVQDYAKNEKHVIVQQNGRCLLHIPFSDKYESAEQLIAFVLRKVVNVAASKYKATFRSASFALKYDSLRSKRIVRAHAEVARLAGLRDVFGPPWRSRHYKQLYPRQYMVSYTKQRGPLVLRRGQIWPRLSSHPSDRE